MCLIMFLQLHTISSRQKFQLLSILSSNYAPSTYKAPIKGKQINLVASDFIMTLSGVPNHHNGYNSNTQQNSKKFESWCVNLGRILRYISLCQQMIYWYINEHPTSQTHWYGKDPISNRTLGCGINYDPNGDANRAGDGKGKSIGGAGK